MTIPSKHSPAVPPHPLAAGDAGRMTPIAGADADGRSDTLSPAEVRQARERRLVAMRLQEIEGNPLSAEDIAMFEMFEREAWSHERCRAYILARAKTIVTQ